MLISMNKGNKFHYFVSFSASSFNEAIHFKGCVFLLCKTITMEIINMQMRHYLHNGKGYRALPYTKLKLMLCAFQPYIKPNFGFLWHISPFLRAGHKELKIAATVSLKRHSFLNPQWKHCCRNWMNTIIILPSSSTKKMQNIWANFNV